MRFTLMLSAVLVLLLPSMVTANPADIAGPWLSSTGVSIELFADSDSPSKFRITLDLPTPPGRPPQYVDYTAEFVPGSSDRFY